MLLPTAPRAAWAALLSTAALVSSASASTAPAHSSNVSVNHSHAALSSERGHYAVQHQLARDALALGIAKPAVGAAAGGARRRRRRVGAKRDTKVEKVRGVSLGGWLVSEPFITPSLYKAANLEDPRIMDEWSFCAYQSQDAAAEALTQHWKTWITRDDIRQISEAGLTHIRIPIGYWALDVSGGEPYIQGSLLYLIEAVGWAKEFGLQVMIDLHSAPGSQNGFDNSGKRGTPQWHLSASNVARTENVLLALTVEFAKEEYAGVVTAITPLNEPGGYRPGVTDVAVAYYEQGYKLVRSVADNSLTFLMHDAFKPFSFWDGFMNSAPYENTALDTHIYSVFNDFQIGFNESERISYYCSLKGPLARADQNLPTIVGEWTVAPTDCSQKMNWITYTSEEAFGKQIGSGSHFDGTLPDSTFVGSCEGMSGRASTFSEEYKEYLGRLWEVQADAFEAGTGWVMWAWKMEAAADWSYQDGLAGGWIPKDPTERRYGDQCA